LQGNKFYNKEVLFFRDFIIVLVPGRFMKTARLARDEQKKSQTRPADRTFETSGQSGPSWADLATSEPGRRPALILFLGRLYNKGSY
jgi:hypothetical protein